MFFKRTKIDNSKDFEATSAVLPVSKREVTIAQLVNEADEMEAKKAEVQFANGEHMVKVGEEEMSVNALIEKYNAMKSSADADADDLAKQNAEKEKIELEQKQNAEAEEAKKLAEKAAADEALKKNEEVETEEGVKKNAFFEVLKNAPDMPLESLSAHELSEDKVARGKSRYGSQ